MRNGPLCFAALLAVVVAGSPATAADAKRPPLTVAIACSDDRDFPEFIKHLEANYHVRVLQVRGVGKGRSFEESLAIPFKNLEALNQADVILSSLYRTWAPKEQLEILKKAFLTRPVVGLRRAHHGFQNWLEVDREVFGITYKGHNHGANFRIDDKQKDNPLLEGLKLTKPDGGFYGLLDPSPDVEPLLVVDGEKGRAPMPQTWIRINKETGQRIFYTRYGPLSLPQEDVRDLVIRALFWAADKDINAYRKGR